MSIATGKGRQMRRLTKVDLAVMRELALSPNFPTPNCLRSTDVAYYEDVKHLPEIQKHVAECIWCWSMLKALGMVK